MSTPQPTPASPPNATDSLRPESSLRCDDELDVRRAQSGDPEALDRLLRKYEPSIYRIARLIHRDANDALDVAQETLLRVARNISGYRPSARFRAWVNTILRNVSASHWRRAQRGREALEGYAQSERSRHAGGHDPVERALERDEELAELVRALGTLDPPEREVVVLRSYEGLKFREIAEITGAPLNTVLARMRRATTRLQERMRGTR